MENNVTINPVEKTPEQIEAEMFATRESLTEKVAALENQVVGTVQNAAHTITDTVDAVKSFVETAPEAVSETVEQVASAVKEHVKKTFDISSQVRDYPWASVGVAVGVGFLTSYLVSGDRGTASSSASSSASSTTPLAPTPFASREPGMFDDLLHSLGRKVREKVRELTETAIDAAAAALNQSVRAGIPRLVEEVARKYMPDRNVNPRSNPAARGYIG